MSDLPDFDLPHAKPGLNRWQHEMAGVFGIPLAVLVIIVVLSRDPFGRQGGGGFINIPDVAILLLIAPPYWFGYGLASLMKLKVPYKLLCGLGALVAAFVYLFIWK